jgi:GntR family transcriptional regulator / MocR family aminotransferase
MLLDLDGRGPIYQQVSRAIESALRNGRLAAGGRLPSTRDLAQELKISRNTARAAYDNLAAAGIVTGRPGSGSFAATAPAKAPPSPRAALLAPQSAFSRRAREIPDFSIGYMHRGLRFNLQYGEPLTDQLLPDLWRRELARAAAYTSLGYPVAQGLLDLREQIARYLARRRGIATTADDVIIVSGTQQALSLATRVLLDPGDSAVIEDPGYFGACWAVHAHGARIVPVPVDRHGLVTDGLPARRPGLIYTTPSHQFPLGFVMSKRRRDELLRYARRLDTWILEDDYDVEVSFDAPPSLPLRAADTDDRVIHIGTFSKILAPSLRLAYLVAPRSLRSDFIAAKRLCDMGCSAIEQAALAHFLASGGFQHHLRRVTRALRARRNALIAGLSQQTGHHFSFDAPTAGMHLVAMLSPRSTLDLDELIRAAAKAGVGLYPLAPHYLAKKGPPGLLLGYAGMAPAEIDRACRILGTCVQAGVQASVQAGVPATTSR